MEEVAWFDSESSRPRAEPKGLPLLCSAEDVRAILDGRKTQTRRVMRPQPELIPSGAFYADGSRWWWSCSKVRAMVREKDPGLPYLSPYGSFGRVLPGRLWVRECWRPGVLNANIEGARMFGVQYRAGYRFLWAQDHKEDALFRDWERWPLGQIGDRWGRRRSSRSMPRWASRITLEVEGIRVERLRGISEADARVEGVKPWDGHPEQPIPKLPRKLGGDFPYTLGFAMGWDERYGDHPEHSWSGNPWVWVVGFKVAEVLER